MQALALVDAPDHVCCRYRIRAFAPALEAAGWSLRIEGIARRPLARIAQFARAGRFDAVILQRKLLPGWQFHILRRNVRRLLFDFDDAVLYRDSYDPRGPHCPRRAARFARTVRQADGVLAGNDFLADCAQRAGANPDRVQVVPTCIDVGRYAPKDFTNTAPSNGVQLVWIGSSSTLQGLEQRRPLLERLGREVPGLRLRLICDRFPRFDPLEVVPVPWSEPAEGREIAAGDIGISLVPDDLWTRGKCGLKVLQYRAAGLPVVADPVGVHPRMIRDGVDGFLAGNEDAWVAAIGRLAADPALRTRMGQQARHSVVADYSVAAWSGAFVAAFTNTAPLRTLRINRERDRAAKPKSCASPRAGAASWTSSPDRPGLELPGDAAHQSTTAGESPQIRSS